MTMQLQVINCKLIVNSMFNELIARPVKHCDCILSTESGWASLEGRKIYVSGSIRIPA